MSALALLIVLFAVDITCDVSGQLLFKHGVGRLSQHGEDLPFFAMVRGGLRSPAIWGGLAINVLGFMVWLNLLARIPLSVAYPVVSITYCVILLASRTLLHERISRRRWLGALLVAIGVALVGTALA